MDREEEYSQFISPKKDYPHRLVRVTPPLCHVVSYATGGITALYKKLQDHSHTSYQHEPGDFTDDMGAFQPRDNMPLIAFRYQYVDIIGEGQSCMFVKARDTFRDDALIAIKVLHTTYMQLGAQEMDCIRRINLADPYGTSSTLRLHNVFMFDNHYCMVFDLLHPRPLTDYFKEVSERKALRSIRLVAFKLLQVLGFLKKQNVIHADLKPENVLLEEEGDMLSLKVVDFGNAIHCVHDEVSLYYDDFELQTLLYRAPEVMFGTQFSTEIDMWSLGCILAELYMKRAIFFGRNKKEILQQTVQVLGSFPCNLFQMGKFYNQNKQFTGSSPQKDATYALMTHMNVTHDYHFANFISGMLKFDTKDRMTPAQAARHPFLASVCGFRHLTEDMTDCYSAITLNRNTYKSSPAIAHEVLQKHLSSKALLKEGTKNHLISRKRAEDSSIKQVAEVVPVKRTCKDGKSGYEPVASGSGLDYDEADGIPGITVQRTLSDIMNLIHEEEDKIDDKMDRNHSAGRRDAKITDMPQFRHQCKVPVRVLENKSRKSPDPPFVDRLMAMRMQRQQQPKKRSRTRRSRDGNSDAFNAGGGSDWTEGSVADSTASSRLLCSDSGHGTHDQRENANNRKRRKSVNNASASERDSESLELVEVKTEPVDPTDLKENSKQDDDYHLPSLLLSPSARPLRPAKKNKFSETSSHTSESDIGPAKSRDRNLQFDTHKQRTARQNMLENDRTSSSYHGAKNSGSGVSSRHTDRSESNDFDHRRTSSKLLVHENGAFQRPKGSSREHQHVNSPSLDNKEILIPKRGVLDKLVSNLKKSQTVGRNSDSSISESGAHLYSNTSKGRNESDRKNDFRNDKQTPDFSNSRKEKVLQTASGIRFRESSADRMQREQTEKSRSQYKSVIELDQGSTVSERLSSKERTPDKRGSLGPELAQSPTEKKEWYDFIDTPEDRRKHLFSKGQTPEQVNKRTHEESPGLNLLSPVNYNDRRDDLSSKGKKRRRDQIEDDQSGGNHGNKISKTARRELMSVLDQSGSSRRKEIEINCSDIPDHVRVRGKHQSLCMSSGESRISCSSVSPSSRKIYATSKKNAIFQESFSASALDTEDERECIPIQGQNPSMKKPLRPDHGADTDRQSSGIRRRQLPPEERIRNQGHYSGEDDKGSNHSSQISYKRDGRSRSRTRYLSPPHGQDHSSRSHNSQSPSFRKRRPTPSPQRNSKQTIAEQEGNFDNHGQRRKSVSSHLPPKSSELKSQYSDHRSQPQQHIPRTSQNSRRKNVPNFNPVISPVTGDDGYKFESESESDGGSVSEHDERSPVQTSKLSPNSGSRQDRSSPGRYRDIVSDDTDDFRSNTGANKSKSFRVSPKQNPLPTLRCASPIEEWHSPRHFSQPCNKKSTPVYSTGQRQPANVPAKDKMTMNSQSKLTQPTTKKPASGSFLDSPVSSDNESAFGNGKRPLVDSSIRGKPVNPGKTNLVDGLESGPEDDGGHWHTPSLDQRGIRLQKQQNVHKKPPQQSDKSNSDRNIQNRQKGLDINQNFKDPFSRDTSAEASGRKPLANSQIGQRNQNTKNTLSREASAESQGRKPLANSGLGQRNQNNVNSYSRDSSAESQGRKQLGNTGVAQRNQTNKSSFSRDPSVESQGRKLLANTGMAQRNPHSRDSSAESQEHKQLGNTGIVQRNQINRNQFSRDTSAESRGRKPLANPGLVQRNQNIRKESPVASTSQEYAAKKQLESHNNRARERTRKQSRNPLLFDSSLSPTRSESRGIEEDEIEAPLTPSGRPQRKCQAKKKVTFDASDDSIVSSDNPLDPNYNVGDDDFSPEAKKKRATKKRTPVKSPHENTTAGMPRSIRANDAPYYASSQDYDERDGEEDDYTSNPYGYAGKPNTVRKNLLERNDYRSDHWGMEADGCVLLNL